MSIDRELEMILYSTPESDVTVSAIIKDETLWLNQKSLAELFNVDISTINQHLKNIFETQELDSINYWEIPNSSNRREKNCSQDCNFL